MKREVIEEIIIKAINDLDEKCGISPSQRAEEFDASMFEDERWDNDGELAVGREDENILSPIGELQQAQEDLQNNREYSHLERIASLLWNSGEWHKSINKYIRDGEIQSYVHGWSEEELTDGFVFGGDMGIYSLVEDGMDINDIFDMSNPYEKKQYEKYMKYEPMEITIPQVADTLRKVIDKTKLQNDSIVYRVGKFDGNMKVGDYGKFEGLTSTTYNPKMIDYMKENYDWMDSSDYTMKIYAPKGTNGVVFGDNNLCDGDAESELLLNHNQKYVVLSVDKKNKECEILLY